MMLCIGLLFCACGTEPEDAEYGDFKTVNIDPEEGNATERNLFQKTTEPFGYSYSTIQSNRARMNFEVPNGWRVVMHNARHIEITSPGDDPILPDICIHILYDFNTPSEDEVHPIGAFENKFITDRSVLEYPISGVKYRQASFQSPTEQKTNETMSYGDNNLSSLSLIEPVNMVNDVTGRFPKEICTALYYYVNWYDTAASFNCVCKTEQREQVASLLEYMVSSITYSEWILPSTATVELSGVALRLPTSFAYTQDAYMASITQSTPYSGCGVSVYTTGDGSKLTRKQIEATEANRMVSGFLPGGSNSYNNMYVLYPEETILTMDGVSMTKYFGTCTIMPKGNYAGCYHTAGQTWYLAIYVPVSGSDISAICVWFQDSQAKPAAQLINLIEQNTKFQ